MRRRDIIREIKRHVADAIRHLAEYERTFNILHPTEIILDPTEIILEWARGRDPGGRAANMIEILNQSNDLMQGVLWRDG